MYHDVCIISVDKFHVVGLPAHYSEGPTLRKSVIMVGGRPTGPLFGRTDTTKVRHYGRNTVRINVNVVRVPKVHL